MKKFFNTLSIILLIIAAVILIKSFANNKTENKTKEIEIHTEIQNPKETYKIGDQITLVTLIQNNSSKTFTKTFSSTDTDPIVYIKETNFSNKNGLMSGQALTDVIIEANDNKNYLSTYTLVESNSFDLFTNTGNQLVVAPGKNTLEVTWHETNTIEINVE